MRVMADSSSRYATMRTLLCYWPGTFMVKVNVAVDVLPAASVHLPVSVYLPFFVNVTGGVTLGALSWSSAHFHVSVTVPSCVTVPPAGTGSGVQKIAQLLKVHTATAVVTGGVVSR